jgi:hypothetical protein
MIKLTQAVRVGGVAQAVGAILTLERALEADLVRRGAAVWAGDDPTVTEDLRRNLVFSADLLTTLVPEVGSVPYWGTTSADTAKPTVADHRGIVRTCQVNEARFEGARRVENLLGQSNNLDTSPWSLAGTASIAKIGPTSGDPDLLTDEGRPCFTLTSNGTSNSLVQVLAATGAGTTDGVLRPVKHTVRFDAYLGTAATVTCDVYVSGGATAGTATVTPVAGWTTFSFTFTPDGTSAYRIRFYSASAGTVTLADVQLEDMAGLPADANGNVPASEYVSRGSVTVTAQSVNVFHGAMVDGIKYFATENANTLNNATKVLTKATGTALDPSTLLGAVTEPQCIALTTGAETLSGWTINSSAITITAAAAEGPDGLQSAIRLTEDPANGASKFCSFDVTVTDSKKFCAMARFRAGGTRDWGRIGLRTKAGTTRTVYFNVTTGAIGTLPASTEAYMWRDSVHSDWWFCAVVTSAGTGGSTPQVHIGLANGDGNASYTGAADKYLDVWGVIAFQKEHPQTYFSPDRWSTARRTGSALAYPVYGLIGRNNIGLYIEQHAYWDTGIIDKTNNGTDRDWFSPIKCRANNPDSNYNRFGIAIRPYVDPIEGFAIIAADRYLGEPTSRLRWRANKAYNVGDFVVPIDTEADNANARKIFTCMQAGVSGGSPPTFDTTYVAVPDNVTNITVDGTVRWQCNEKNATDSGIYDPNDGNHPRVNARAAVGGVRRPGRFAYAITDEPDFRVVVNGVDGVITTEPFPIDGSEKGDLRAPMAELRIARNGQSRSPSSQASRYVRVWSGGMPAWSYFQARTRGEA